MINRENSSDIPENKIPKKVWLTSSEGLSRVCDLLPSNKGRQSLVTSLIKAYGLDKKCEDIICIRKVKREELESFHGKEFLDELLRERPSINRDFSDFQLIKNILQHGKYNDVPKKSTSTAKEQIDILKLGDELSDKYTKNTGSDSNDSDDESSSEFDDSEANITDEDDNFAIQNEDLKKLESYGLTHDCYIFPFMADYVNLVSASSLHSARRLSKESKNPGSQNIVINWYGGRHHCKKNHASGFCYVNDIVLSINVLRRTFRKVFYLDLDLHHGDGVESAFEFSKNVMTCSIHRYDIGFYPGTGNLDSTSEYRVNIPTKRGLNDENMLRIIKEIVLPIIQKFSPDVLVIQAGCDGLATDEHNEWNMTIQGYGRALECLLTNFRKTSIMVLGGGGYNHTETAKCWTYLTQVAIGEEGYNELWGTIPDHVHLDAYQHDGFQFWTQENSNPKKMKDENVNEYIEETKAYILSKCT